MDCVVDRWGNVVDRSESVAESKKALQMGKIMLHRVEIVCNIY